MRKLLKAAQTSFADKENEIYDLKRYFNKELHVARADKYQAERDLDRYKRRFKRKFKILDEREWAITELPSSDSE